tara:strand:- start:5371 stop:5823 length:453 start_codon:yes stop_codon:yes gene_type:complete
MKFDLLRFNRFNFFNLPAAWWTGVRVTHLDKKVAEVSVKHRWINQNPFGSIFWAVQGMAAELSTAAFVMTAIKKTGRPVSMLVLTASASFKKKAKGLIKFQCDQGLSVSQIVENAVKTGEPEKFILRSVGTDEDGNVVSTFEFEWSIKRK